MFGVKGRIVNDRYTDRGGFDIRKGKGDRSGHQRWLSYKINLIKKLSKPRWRYVSILSRIAVVQKRL